MSSSAEVDGPKDLKRKALEDPIESPRDAAKRKIDHGKQCAVAAIDQSDFEDITREILERGQPGGGTRSLKEFLDEANSDLGELAECRESDGENDPGNKEGPDHDSDDGMKEVKLKSDYNLLFCREVVAMGERQRAWKRPTSMEILDDVLVALKHDHNILGFYNFSVGPSCGHKDMCDLIEKDYGLGSLKGYVFSHSQSTDHIMGGGTNQLMFFLCVHF